MAKPKYLTIENVTPEEERKILSNISVNSVTGCWIWTAAHSNGYGAAYFRGETILAHRLIYAWRVGPVPLHGKKKTKGLPELDHATCDNRSCVNPNHLKLVTTKENVLRGSGPTAINAKKTHCKRGHLLPTYPNVSGGRGRKCDTCAKELYRIRYNKLNKTPRKVYKTEEERRKAWRESNKKYKLKIRASKIT